MWWRGQYFTILYFLFHYDRASSSDNEYISVTELLCGLRVSFASAVDVKLIKSLRFKVFKFRVRSQVNKADEGVSINFLIKLCMFKFSPGIRGGGLRLSRNAEIMTTRIWVRVVSGFTQQNQCIIQKGGKCVWNV